uniref:Ecdysone-induced protein 75B, isoforms C/D n=1 Tax=Zeugodacus cucurbitae TaxID=28588 RepID=A0A0A1WW20_ZEUCU
MGSIERACISGFLCRLCSEMHRIVIHIYGDQGRKLCLVEKINGYLPITISPTDPLPKTICETCLRRVEQHYDLLMRLTRIKEGSFPKIKKTQQALCTIGDVSSTDVSDDEHFDHNSTQEGRNSLSDPIAQQIVTGVASQSPLTGATQATTEYNNLS